MLDLATAHDLIHRTRPPRSRDGYPPDVRDAVTELAAAEVARGRTLTATARAMGLHPATLRRWLDDAGEQAPLADPRAAYLPVVLSGAAAPGSPDSRLAVVSPSGFRLEGLDLESAIVALRRLS